MTGEAEHLVALTLHSIHFKYLGKSDIFVLKSAYSVYFVCGFLLRTLVSREYISSVHKLKKKSATNTNTQTHRQIDTLESVDRDSKGERRKQARRSNHIRIAPSVQAHSEKGNRKEENTDEEGRR